jgi:DNA-binding MarR family transcriptional regulator
MGSEPVDPDSFRRFILSQLAEEITTTPFKSSIRLIIIMSLGIGKRMRLTDLMKLTGCGKGSISNHINKLEKFGFVTTRDVSIFTSPRIVVEITNKGEEFYNSYLDMLERIINGSNQVSSDKTSTDPKSGGS